MSKPDKIILDPEQFEKHLLENHFMRYQDYCEISLLGNKDPDSFCYRCSDYRDPLTYLAQKDVYYLPCWKCMSPRKLDRSEATKSIILNIKDYYTKLLGDRYQQLYIVDDIYFRSTLKHDYLEFKRVLGKLDLPDRKDIWFLDWLPGFPRIVDEANLQGLKIVNLSKLYKITSEKKVLKVNNYEVLFPELVKYDVRHHSRYNILNKNSDRKTKRLRLPESDSCVKFFNNLGDSKSIFQVINTETKEIIEDLNNISYQDLVILKLSILRNKSYLKLVYDIVYELLGYTGIYKDGVLLKNTIPIDPEKSFNLELSWLPIEGGNDYKFINISIL